MNFLTRVFLSALLPVIVASGIFGLILRQQAADFEQQMTQTIKQALVTQKKQALSDYTEIANGAIDAIPTLLASPDQSHQTLTKLLLAEMGFGADGYFYAYTLEGVNLVHPILPELQGQDLIEWRDVNDDPLIQNLIAAAQAKTGFHSYTWNRPSTDSDEPKIGHVVAIEDWNWMIGTGMYIDDIDRELASISTEIEQSVVYAGVILFVLVIVMVLVIAGLLSLFRYSEGQAANRQVRQLATQVLDAQETERKRVSLELHDGIGQVLVSSLYAIESAQLSADKREEFLERASNAIRNAIEEVRRISRGLRPAAIDDLGLAQAAKELVRSMTDVTDLTPNIDIGEIDSALTLRQRTTLYRVMQEALANVVKHAEASQLWIHVRIENAKVRMHIQDDGKGMTRAEVQYAKRGNTLGLKGMQERVMSQNGKFSMLSKPNEGTTIKVSFPVSPQPAAE